MPQMVANKYLLTAKYPEHAWQDFTHSEPQGELWVRVLYMHIKYA